MTEKITHLAGGMIKHSENPFLNTDEISFKNKQVRISVTGKDQNILINQETGETNATHVIAYKKVDDGEFVKVFTANIALTFGLSSAGQKVFNMLLHVVQKTAIGRDKIYLNDLTRSEFSQDFKVKLSNPTFYRGLAELITSKIIARSVDVNIYFINPHLVFNGDRIAFTQSYERVKKEKTLKKINNEEQGELDV
jgi:hypothetical protein